MNKIKVLDVSPAQWITTLTYYDKKARPIYTDTENSYLGTVDIVESQLDFVGRLQQVRTEHTKDGSTIVTLDNFTYDHVGRLLKQTQCIGNESLGYTCPGSISSSVVPNLVINNGTVATDQVASNSITVTNSTITNGTLSIVPNTGDEELIVENRYDELGQLQAKKVGGVPGIDYASTAGLQTVDYTYNVRGWLKMINQDQNNDNDLFNFSLNYNDPTLSGATALFNGNISETHWETANDNTARNYQYTYDPLNRITSATDNTNKYNVSNISYDKNGNIETLKREGWTTASPSLANNTGFGTMDDLTYTYTGNQLKAVDDDIASSATQGFVEGVEQATEYTYDGNGNMLTDANKGITGVDYNHLNLPTSVSLAGGTISYIYNAVGTKLKKTVGSTETEYAGNYVYEGGTLQFFNHPEGYVTSNGSGGYDYVYQYKDHLGNVRLSYMDNNGTLEIIEENNYYPFGLEHKGYNNIVNGTENNYQTFMGKEHQKELGLETYDFGARNYDPAIGRWMNLDPLAEQMRRHSPYNFAFDNPIRFIDPDGMAPLDVVINGDLAEKATEQLNASSSLEITRDAETGKLSATGTADTESDVALLEAINDENVVVNVNASSDNVTENGGLIVGDVFGGNTEIPEMNITFADQQVNPNQAETIENFAGMETGSVMKHGVLEAYAGAVVSPNAPSSAENPSSSEYGTAHGISNTIYPGGDAAKAGLGASIGQSNRQYVGGGTWTSDVSVKITKSGKSITLYTVKYREQE